MSKEEGVMDSVGLNNNSSVTVGAIFVLGLLWQPIKRFEIKKIKRKSLKYFLTLRMLKFLSIIKSILMRKEIKRNGMKVLNNKL